MQSLSRPAVHQVHAPRKCDLCSTKVYAFSPRVAAEHADSGERQTCSGNPHHAPGCEPPTKRTLGIRQGYSCTIGRSGSQITSSGCISRIQLRCGYTVVQPARSPLILMATALSIVISDTYGCVFFQRHVLPAVSGRPLPYPVDLCKPSKKPLGVLHHKAPKLYAAPTVSLQLNAF